MTPTASAVHFVTGATGLIGGHLVRRLTGEGLRVRALVRARSSVSALKDLGVELTLGDLCDAASVRHAMDGASCVYHCGALVSDWGARKSFQAANVEGTRHVAEAAVSQNVERFVHLSSAAVYGYPRMELIGEHLPARSRRIPYIESKIAAEQIVWRAIEQQGLPATVLRPVTVFGPGCQNYVGEVVRHLRKRSMVLLNGGRHVAGLAYVENVVDAILSASQSTQAIAQAMNVCDDSPVTWKEYVDRLADGIGAPRVRVSLPAPVAYALAVAMETAGKLMRRRRRPLLTRLMVLEWGQTQRYAICRARRLLGYSPRVPFEEAMSATIHWVNEHL